MNWHFWIGFLVGNFSMLAMQVTIALMLTRDGSSLELSRGKRGKEE